MSDQDQKKQTPESTRRFRMLKSALENVEKSPDETYAIFLAEYGAMFELYQAAKTREVESRLPRSQGVVGSSLKHATEAEQRFDFRRPPAPAAGIVQK